MTRDRDGQEAIQERLRTALEQLRRDVNRVEIWATALGSFAEPVPDYEPDARYRLGGQTADLSRGPQQAAQGRDTGRK